MKTTAISKWTAVSFALWTACAAVNARADQAVPAGKNEKSYTGTILSVDAGEHTLHVKGLMLEKSFNLGESCAITLPDDRPGAAGDLRPGQKVRIDYRDSDGVLVADRLQQEALRFEGVVREIDAAKHTMTVRERELDKTFQLPADCAVSLRNATPGQLSDVEAGNRVTVTYEIPGGVSTARQIAQTSAVFTGSVTAIDLGERTVKAKSMLSSRKLNVADNCAIIINGKPDAHLGDLKLGDRLMFSYDEINGVNVVTRIATAEKAQTPEALTASSDHSHDAPPQPLAPNN